MYACVYFRAKLHNKRSLIINDSVLRVYRRCAYTRDSPSSSATPSSLQIPHPTSSNKNAVFEALPAWFRVCVDDIYKKRHGSSFQAAFDRTANTTMPALQHIHLPHILATKRAECKLVHVSRAEICMCSLSMLRIRFEVGPLPALFVCIIHFIMCVSAITLRHSAPNYDTRMPTTCYYYDAGLQVPRKERGDLLRPR